jgi:molecular chaperone DnaJ
MAGQDWFEKDFYAVLGVPVDAKADAVKKAYRKLARKHHPDANGGDPAAERRFKEIGEAYAVLSDAEQRQQYDAVRAMARGGARFTAGGAGGPGGGGFDDVFGGLFGGGQPGGGRPGAAPGNVRYTSSGPGGPSLEDLLGGVFGNRGSAGGTGFRAPRAPRKGEDLSTEATLTFSQSVDGALLSLRVSDPMANGTRTVNSRIPAGVRDGQKVRLRGKGRPGDPGGEPGDLVITVHVEPHPIFSLDGEDVRVTVPVTFPEAVLGADIEVPTLGGGTVRLKVPAGTPSGRILRLKGRGVHGPRRTGDLLVAVQVLVPQRVDGAAREAVEAFRTATVGEDPRAELLAGARRAHAGAGDGR